MANKKTRKYDFTVKGMSCASCEKIIERALKKTPGVKNAKANYSQAKLTIEVGPKADFQKIYTQVGEKGYEIYQEEETDPTRMVIKVSTLKDAAITFGLLLVAIGFYTYLGPYFETLMPSVGQNASLLLLFTLGFFTGFHCIAMCGGFVIGYSTKSKKHGRNQYMDHAVYGLSKTVSYAVIGAFFGYVGSIVTFTPAIRGGAAVLAGVFLVMFGLNMLDMMKWFRKYRFKTPKFLQKFTVNTSKEHSSPMTIGLLNGLLIACGPLQAMYLMAAASASPLWGAIYLAAFSLGTLPVLLGFGMMTSLAAKSMTNKIIRYSGVLVILLGLIMVNRGVALTGIGYDLNTLTTSMEIQSVSAQDVGQPVASSDDPGVQVIEMEVTRYGWKPDVFVLKKGVPVVWKINGKEITGCNNAIQVPSLNLEFPVKSGIQEIKFTPEKEGVIAWSCWMGMIPGTFIVKDDIQLGSDGKVDASSEEVKEAIASAPPQPSGGSCGGTCGGSCGGGCGCGG